MNRLIKKLKQNLLITKINTFVRFLAFFLHQISGQPQMNACTVILKVCKSKFNFL